MLIEEEKEAIEILKLYFGDNPTLNITKYVNIVLNLIEKQSKEIEELKKGFKIQEHNYQVAMEEIEQRCEDKIKAEIEEQKNMRVDGEVFTTSVNYAIKVLQSLLEKE